MRLKLNPNESCFPDVCDCQCRTTLPEFDLTIQSETKLPFTLDVLCRSNIGWFTDKTLSDHLITEWQLGGCNGVYLLWHKDAYCDQHDLFHMKSLYVGKGNIHARLVDHWKKKDFTSEMLVYWTYMEMPNRQAKYVEQLLLDTFKFPFNKNECHGEKRLCAYLDQGEVD